MKTIANQAIMNIHLHENR